MGELKTDKLVIYQIFTRLLGNQNTTNKFGGNVDENGVGKFCDINKKALKSIKNLGVSHVWFTGIIEHALMTDYSKYGIQKDHPSVVKGKAGSPYAIKDYYDVNPDLAVDVNNRMQEFEELLKRSHDENLKVIIDFVPNHLARQYKSDAKPAGIRDFGEDDNTESYFLNQNNFYYIPNNSFVSPESSLVGDHEKYTEFPAKATGNDVFSAQPSINDWYETVKLNYGIDYLNGKTKHFDPIPNTWLKLKDVLLFWAKKGIDGFRCDMAEMVPVEFWQWVILEVKKDFPDVIFIAEVYNPQEYRNYIFNGKFDYLYDKVGLYDALRRLIEGYGSVSDITRVWQQESGEFSSHMLRFLENHDEQRIASKEFAGNPKKAFAAMALSATLHSGPVILYFGQELGVNPNKSEGFSGNDGRTTIFDYWGIEELQNWIKDHEYSEKNLSSEQAEIRNFYADLCKFVNKNETVKFGKFFDLQYINNNGQSQNYDNDKIYSYLRYTDSKICLFVYNFDLSLSKQITLKFPIRLFNEELSFKEKTFLSLKETLSGKSKIKINKEECFEGLEPNKGIPISLEPNSFKIFEIT